MARKRESQRQELDRRTADRNERGSYEEHLAHLGEGAQYQEGWEEYSWLGQPERKRKQDQRNKKAPSPPSNETGGSGGGEQA